MTTAAQSPNFALPVSPFSSWRPRAEQLAATLPMAQSALWALYRGQQLGLAMLTTPLLGVVRLAMRGRRRATPPPAQERAIVRRYRELLDRDLANAARGDYPRSLLFQFPLADYLRRVPEGLLDLPRLVLRVRRGQNDDLPPEVDRSRYPHYYLRNFHWQTDGWMSDRSARLYDLSVELLFGGTADVMRRMALPPIVEAARKNESGAPLRVLDAACGTGRFLLQLHRALPDARLTGVDLSSAYLAHAGRLLAGSGAELKEANAERLPFADGSFDVVSSVFLFHELPRDARRNVLAELYRVLAPGGRLVLLDSEQLVSGGEIEFFLRAFPRDYHEPYFKGYLDDDLAAALRETGFAGVRSESHLVSRMVAGDKPR